MATTGGTMTTCDPADVDAAAERLDRGYDGPLIDVLPQALMDARQVSAAYLSQRDEIANLRKDSLAMAGRIAAQAELLAKRAEAVPVVDVGEFASLKHGSQLSMHRDHDATGYPTFYVNGLSGEQKRDDKSLDAMLELFRAAPALLAELTGMRKELADVDDACSAIVRHTTPAECVGCGCVSLSPAERAAYLARDYERLRAANAELLAHLTFAVKLLKGIVGYPAQVEAMEAALARHDAEKGRGT